MLLKKSAIREAHPNGLLAMDYRRCAVDEIRVARIYALFVGANDEINKALYMNQI